MGVAALGYASFDKYCDVMLQPVLDLTRLRDFKIQNLVKKDIIMGDK